jgi:hypothetical protein
VRLEMVRCGVASAVAAQMARELMLRGQKQLPVLQRGGSGGSGVVGGWWMAEWMACFSRGERVSGVGLVAGWW